MIRITEHTHNTDDQAHLNHFAQHRLAHFGISHDLETDAHDLIQQSLCAIVRGINGKAGRIPNEKDVATRAAFQNYLRDVINSTAEGWARTYHREHRSAQLSLDLIQEWLADNRDSQIEYRDIKTLFFARLRRRVTARLLPTVDAWEKAPDGRIPCLISRKHVSAVRKSARQIAKELIGN